MQHRRSIFIWLGAGVLVAALVVAPGMRLHVSAHAALDRSNPAADAVVSETPAQLELFFTQEIDESGTEIRVLGPDGARVDNQDTTLDLMDPERKRVTVTLQSNLPAGPYTVEWVSFSDEDGEEDSGSFTFTVAGTSASPIASPASSPSASPAASPTQAAG